MSPGTGPTHNNWDRSLVWKFYKKPFHLSIQNRLIYDNGTKSNTEYKIDMELSMQPSKKENTSSCPASYRTTPQNCPNNNNQYKLLGEQVMASSYISYRTTKLVNDGCRIRRCQDPRNAFGAAPQLFDEMLDYEEGAQRTWESSPSR
jgi:hypothetical protein